MLSFKVLTPLGVTKRTVLTPPRVYLPKVLTPPRLYLPKVLTPPKVYLQELGQWMASDGRESLTRMMGVESSNRISLQILCKMHCGTFLR